MIHHYLTKYVDENNQLVVEAWLQLNVLGRCFTFSDRKMIIKKPSEDGR